MSNDEAIRGKALKFVEILKTTDTFSAEKMQAYQRRLMERLVRHAKAEVPFYDSRLNPLFGPKDTIRWDAWTDIEPFTRAQAQEAGDSLFAKNTPSQAGNYVTETTSGSTGMPLKVRSSGLMSLMSSAINQRIFDWHGINPDSTVCFILDDTGRCPYPEGETGENWNLTNPKAVAHGLSVNHTVEQQAEWVYRKQPDILLTYPKNGAAIIEELQGQHLDIPFSTMIVHGEILEKDTRRTAESAGIKIIDRFGSVELGPLSVNCTHGPWHHQFSEVALMEVVSPEGQLAEPQAPANLVATSFYNYAMPLIRYKNGDLVEVSRTACPCGRSLPRIDRILGRERNMFRFSDGTLIRPDMSRNDYEPFLSAKQFQVVQHSLQQIEIRYVADKWEQPVNVSGLTELLRKVLHHDIRVQITQVDKIERSTSGKFETWKSSL